MKKNNLFLFSVLFMPFCFGQKAQNFQVDNKNQKSVLKSVFKNTDQTLSQTIDEIPDQSGFTAISACYDATNAYMRIFDLSDYQIDEDFEITKISTAAFVASNTSIEGFAYYLNGETSDDIPFKNFEDINLKSKYTNNDIEFSYGWVDLNVEEKIKLNPNRKIAIAIKHYYSKDDYIDTAFPLYTTSGEKKPAYFGSPNVGCYAVKEGYVSTYSSFLGNDQTRPILLTITGKTKSLGIVEIGANTFNLSPNPTRDQLTIHTNGSIVNKIEIIDSSGKIMEVKHSKHANVLDVSNLKTGMYFIRIKDDKNVTRIQKFIKA